MAEETKRDKPDEKAEVPAENENPKASGKTAWLRRFLSRKWIAILVVALTAINGIAYACVRLAASSPPPVISPEVSLGVFRFEADEGEVGRIAAAEFALHIALLKQVDQPARRRLENYQFRVQQDVEELLRRAHGGDFDDPNLGELKRQLQARINETLGMRAIAEVIITDLKLQKDDADLGLATDTGESVPWVEEPSG